MTVATTRFSGRAFSVREVTLIREIVRDCSGLSRMELMDISVKWNSDSGDLEHGFRRSGMLVGA